MDFVIDKRFKSRVERSDRVLEVAEAFGLGLNDKEFVIYDGFTIDVQPGDVIYITGQSGSGKSLLLRELAAQMSEKGFKVASIDQVELLDKPLIDQVGKDTTQSINLLSRAGISDAYLYVRKPGELSDGQKYRLRLAKLIESGAEVWVADEFGAVLDRVTAKVVAFNVAKAAREHARTLIVATTHTDLAEELGPSLTITKRFRDRIDVTKGQAA